MECRKLPDYFSDISLTKAILRTFLNRNCFSEHFPQLHFKYLWEFMLHSKFSFKNMTGPYETYLQIYIYTCMNGFTNIHRNHHHLHGLVKKTRQNNYSEIDGVT